MNKLLIICMLFSTTLMASPIKGMDKVGEGKMHYLFWTLYNAELYRNTTSQALSITYYKSISKQALIDATEDQWQHLGYKEQAINMWLQPLNQIWPDVSSGDQLTVVVHPKTGSQFYLDDNIIGTIPDTSFGHAFLAIWLADNTSEPKLRQQLLGLEQ